MKKMNGILNKALCFIMVFTLFYIQDPMNVSAGYSENNQFMGSSFSNTMLHVALVMDASGSIHGKYETEDTMSDPDWLSREAAKVVVDRLPSVGNQIAMFEYSETIKTTVELSPIESEEDVLRLGKVLDNMRTSEGGTYMINAIKEAREYLDEHHDPEAKDIIIVFTDGAETGRFSARNSDDPDLDTKIDAAVTDAMGSSKAIVYSVGFDYAENVNGKIIHSLTGDKDKEGYGMKILTAFADRTGGKVMPVRGNITDMDQSFDEIISNLTHTRAVNDEEITADGSSSTSIVHIDESVMEANIRISCPDLDKVKNGTIRLFAPDSDGNYVKGQNEVSLEDGKRDKNIWMFKDRLSVCIKLKDPVPGDWAVELSDVISDSTVKLNVVENYNMKIVPEISFRDGSSPDNVTPGDVMNLQVHLFSEDKEVSQAIYDDPLTQKTLFVWKMPEDSDESDKIDVQSENPDMVASRFKKLPGIYEAPMVCSDGCYEVNVPFDEFGSYLVSVWINSKSYYTYCDFVVSVGDSIVMIKDIPSVSIYNGQEYVIKDLLSYCSQPLALCEIVDAKGSGYSANLENGDLVILGEGVGNGEIELKFTSPGDSTTRTNVKVKTLNDPPHIVIPDDQRVKKVDVDYYTSELVIKDFTTDLENDPVRFEIIEQSDESVTNLKFDNLTGTISALAKNVGVNTVKVRAFDPYGETIVEIRFEVSEKKKQVSIGFIVALIVAGLVLIGLISLLVYWATRKLKISLQYLTFIDQNGKAYPIHENFELSKKLKGTSCAFYDIVQTVQNESSATNDQLDNAKKAINECFRNGTVVDAAKSILFLGGHGSIKIMNGDKHTAYTANSIDRDSDPSNYGNSPSLKISGTQKNARRVTIKLINEIGNGCIFTFICGKVGISGHFSDDRSSLIGCVKIKDSVTDKGNYDDNSGDNNNGNDENTGGFGGFGGFGSFGGFGNHGNTDTKNSGNSETGGKFVRFGNTETNSNTENKSGFGSVFGNSK